MRSLGRFAFVLSLSIACFCACKAGTQASTQFTTLSATQGGKIVYGVVNGATTEGAAMSSMLKTVHNNCGEKPQIGKVFQFTGTHSVGVFFAVTDHSNGNLPLGGLVIARAAGARTMEAAMVYDLASRFGQTVNPMLQQLFSAWNPSGTTATGSEASGASASAGKGVSLPSMHQVNLPDGTGSISLPNGWNLVPNQSGMGIATVNGPNGEILGLNYDFNAWDTDNQSVQNMQRRGLRFQQTVYYPANADLTKSFETVFQMIRAAMGQGKAPIKVDSVQASSSQGQCVNATGQLNPDGAGMRQMQMLLCRSTPNQLGAYQFILTKCLLPLGATDQQRATADAIMATFKPDMQRAQSIANAQSAPIIAQMQQTYQAHQQALMSFTQQQIANIHQIGADATARYNAAQASNAAQQSSWEAQEDAEGRNAQGFSNYLLDQTVVQNNYTGAHSTQWNSVADSLVNANPNKYSYVNTPNYIPGTDY